VLKNNPKTEKVLHYSSKELMNKLKNILVLFLLVAIPVIIYIYFLQWKTTTMYGDDLYIYKTHDSLNTFSKKIICLSYSRNTGRCMDSACMFSSKLSKKI
jgi:hypothetical protein